MKVLLDENLPHDLRHFIAGHDCFTVAFMGWKGVTNGALLAKAAGEGFDVVVTQDAGMQHQQNIEQIPVAVVAIRAQTNRLDDLRPLVPAILEALAELKPRTFVRVG